VDRGEMLNEPGDSWFSPKCLEGQPLGVTTGGKALDGPGGVMLTAPNQTTNTRGSAPASETAGAKLRRREGNSPDHQLRSLSAD
jgi:hypothetical protein